MSDLKEHLKRIAFRKELPITANPWTYRCGTIATNGRVYLWVPLVWPEFPEAGDAVCLKFDGVWTPRGTERAMLHDVGSLRGWAEPVVWSEPCPACKGTSKVSEHIYCSFCDSEGECLPEPRRGYLYGVPLDRNYLAMVLAHWPGPMTLRGPALGDNEPLFLTGEWRAGAMPMSDQWSPGDRPNPWLDAPRFPCRPYALGGKAC